MEPSQPPEKQSWKERRMAARASSLHTEPSRNQPFNSEATSVQTAGHELWRLTRERRLLLRSEASRFSTEAAEETSEKVRAWTLAVAERRRMEDLEKCIMTVCRDGVYNSQRGKRGVDSLKKKSKR